VVRVVRGGAIALDGTSIALGADIKAELIYPPFHGKFVLKESERRELSFLSFASSQRPDEC